MRGNNHQLSAKNNISFKELLWYRPQFLFAVTILWKYQLYKKICSSFCEILLNLLFMPNHDFLFSTLASFSFFKDTAMLCSHKLGTTHLFDKNSISNTNIPDEIFYTTLESPKSFENNPSEIWTPSLMPVQYLLTWQKLTWGAQLLVTIFWYSDFSSK